MRYLMILLFAICVGATIAMTAGAAQTPETVLPIFVDYEAPPPDMNRFVSVADAVVVVRVEAVRFESVADSKGRPRDVTRYDVRLLETIKPYAKLPPAQEILTITREGGQHNENGRVVRSAEQGFENFEPNGEYLLFLSWNAFRREFDITYGPSGAYQLGASGTVRALGKAAVSVKQQGRDRNAFLNELRVASGR